MSHQGKVVLITGAARGIGYGIAECFAEQEARLVLADVNLEAASRVARSFGQLARTDQEIDHVVAFLASDLASFITGAYFPVCGGNVMPAI